MKTSMLPQRTNALRPMRRFEREMEDLMEHFFVPEDEWPLLRLERRMEEMLDPFFGFESTPPEAGWLRPRVDIAETDGSYEVTLDLPGIKPQEIDIELIGHDLRIRGEIKRETQEEDKTYRRVERRFGKFERIIPIPEQVESDKIEAQYREGVLRVTVPKTPTAPHKHVSVKTE
jgi:HSP20 family protein